MKALSLLALSAILFALPQPVCAAEAPVSATPPPTLDLEAGAEHASLTNGRGDWDSQYARFTRRDGKRALYLEALTTTRFGQYDSQYTGSAFLPIGDRWTAVLEESISPTHRVLPAQSSLFGLQYASGGNWFETVSFRSATYAENSVGTLNVMAEHHWGEYRFSYAMNLADLAFSGTSIEHLVRFDRYYGPQPSFVGFAYVTGREIDAVGLPQVVTSNVHGWHLFGRHWINDRLALAYGANHVVQGGFYSQTGGTLGLRYRL